MRVFIRSFGCSTNQADGQVLAGCLVEAGYLLVDAIPQADIVVYNTCAVKGPTENRMMGLLKNSPKDKKLVVTGCLPLINFYRLNREVHFDGVAGPAVGKGIVEIVGNVARGRKVVSLNGATEAKPRLDLPRRQLDSIISIIPISYGCLGSCAYCCVNLARGKLRSHSISEIVDRAIADLKNGAQEIWVTSQDCASYGRDIGTNLAELLNALCGVKGDFKIRVGMMTPDMTLDFLEDLVQAFDSEHVFKFVHLPVQSGDDQVLKDMRRPYSMRDFKRIVSAFKDSFSKFALSTDVICGFPKESEKAFSATLRLLEDVKPDVVNISKFFARPRTMAAQMIEDFVPPETIRRRSRALARLVKKLALEKNQLWVGQSCEVLFDEKGKIPGSWIGRNSAYKPVVVRNEKSLLGKTLNVEIKQAFSAYLEGQIVE